MSAQHLSTDIYSRMQHLRIRGAPSSHWPLLICLPLHSFSRHPHLSHTWFYFSFTLPPYIVTHIPLYGIHVGPLIIPSICFAYGSVTPLSNAVGIPYWRLWWGMGGPVLLADFNELLWGSDRHCQKWRSAIQPTRFNTSLLTTVFSLYVSKAGKATGRTTRATSKKHMWSVIWLKRVCRNWINISPVLIFHLCSFEEKMETGIVGRDWGFARHARKHHYSIADRWFQNQRHEISQMCFFGGVHFQKRREEAAGKSM